MEVIFPYKNRLIAVGNAIEVRAQIGSKRYYPECQAIRVYAQVKCAGNISLLLHDCADLLKGVVRQPGISVEEYQYLS